MLVFSHLPSFFLPVWKSKFYGAFVLQSTRCLLDGVAMPVPVHSTHWLISTQVNSKKLTPEKLLELDADQLATKDKQEERRKMAEYQHDARSLDWERKNRDRMDKSIGIDNSKTMYPCGKCKSTKVSNYEKQTRSGDEPMTQFFECADCGHRWRF